MVPSPARRRRQPRRLAAGLVRVALLVPLLAAFGGCGGRPAAAPAATTSTTRGSARPPAPPPTQTLNLPAVNAAQFAACESDFRTIAAAEESWALVNGSFATLDQLVAGQYLRDPSRFYTSIRIGTPPGGYTLVAAPDGPCATLPVAGS